MELLFDHQRIAYALETRLKAETVNYRGGQLQVWLLLLLSGSLRKTMRGRQSLSANDCAAELCIRRTRVENEFGKLAERKLITPARSEEGDDKRRRSFVLTKEGAVLAQQLCLLVQRVQSEVLISAGYRTIDRAMDPQCLVMGLWLTGSEEARLPTLTRLSNMPDAAVAGAKRGFDGIRLTKVRTPRP